MASDLRAPLLAQEGREEEPLGGGISPSGRGLSVAALALGRRSSSSLRADDVPDEPEALPQGKQQEIENVERASGLRFAPMPRHSGVSRMSSVSSTAGGKGMRVSSTSSVGFGKEAASVLHRTASNKLLELSANYQSRRELEEQEGMTMPPFVIHPYDIRAHCWWAFISLTVLVTMAAEPAFLAFMQFPGFFPITSPDTIVTSLLIAAYATDIAFNFFVAYHDEDSGCLVTDRRSIARNYAQWRLWVDLATTIPFDWIMLGLLGLNQSSTAKARYVGLLRLIRLGRVYRLKKWTIYLTNNARISLIAVTVMRNVLVLFYTTHIGACLFFFLARQTEGAVVTWVKEAEVIFGSGGAGGGMDDTTALGKYIYSLYWSAVTFATVGYGDIHANTVAEAAFITFFIYINVFVGAYIIGTITLLVTKADEETGRYRSELAVLEQYSSTHSIPKDMQSAMRGHLRLHYSAQEANDERVLSVLPSALRRRVLGHMYQGVLEDSWLFDGCHQKFLDAFLGTAKIEHVMPKVEIVSEGDLVNELMILVAGSCALEAPRPGGPGALSGDHVVLNMKSMASINGGSQRFLGPGEPLAEMAFFTETATLQTVRTTTVCRVLSLSRTAYMALAASFPLSAERMLDNLMDAAKEMVERELRLPIPVMSSLEARGVDLEALAVRYASPELYSDQVTRSGSFKGGSLADAWGDGDGGSPAASDGGLVAGGDDDAAAVLLGAQLKRDGAPLSHMQKMALSNLVRVRMLVGAQRQKLQRERTAEFLEAAAQGNVARMRAMMQQGLHPDSADYDGRTALMLASAHGHMAVIKLLLSTGANPSKTDALQGCALLEAARGGHDATIDALLAAGAKVKMSQVVCAAHLCTCVFEGDVPLLRRMLRAGLDPDAGDYDGRRAAHIAAAESSIAALKVLVEEAGANMTLKDRWGLTPLDEARRGGAAAAATYLDSAVSGGQPQRPHHALGASV